MARRATVQQLQALLVRAWEQKQSLVEEWRELEAVEQLVTQALAEELEQQAQQASPPGAGRVH